MVPVSDADLAASAVSVVRGRVTAIASHWNAGRRQIFTDVTLAVDEVLSGPVLAATVTLRQPGGSVAGLEHWIEGSPEFRVGEPVLVFLRAARDGTLRVAHFFQGKFSIVRDPFSGEDLAVRTPGPGVRMLAPRTPAAGPRDTRRLEDLRALLRAPRRHTPTPPPLQTAPLTSGPIEQSQAFTFNGTPSRWFEADAGQAIPIYTNSAGEPRAPTLGFDQVRQGLAAWSNDPFANFRYQDGGLTGARGIHLDGVSTFTFGDPDGVIDPPVNCSGTLAMGGFFRSGTESRVVNGQTYMRILEGDIVLADGWQGCGFYEVFANLAETATHELGHVLGLGHSTDPDATMYAAAHFDGRGSTLRPDDLAGLRFIYPAPATLAVTLAGSGSGTVTSSPAGISCGADCSEPFAPGTSVTLTATPAGGSTFAGWSGGGCGGTGACTVTVSGSLTVTATFNGAGNLGLAFGSPASGATVSGTTTVALSASGGSGYSYQVRLDGATIFAGTAASFAWDTRTVANGAHTLSATVTDSLGRTASASVPVTVSNSTGALRVAITQPGSGATVSGVPWAVMWVEGASGVSNTFTLTLGGQTVGGGTTSSAGPVSLPYDTRGVPDGVQSLTANVRDAGGATGSQTVSITVRNGTTAPPLTASVTSPAAGATVSGVITVSAAGSGGTPPYSYGLNVDGARVASGPSASFTWNSAGVANGGHTLSVTVTDSAGGSVTPAVGITVSNGAAPPPPPPPAGGTLKVVYTQPASGATVSGTNWVTLWLQGAAGGTNTYTLSVAGQTVATTSTSSTGPVTMAWTTSSVADGLQTLTATARDATGNSGAASVSVSVANGGAPPPPPPSGGPASVTLAYNGKVRDRVGTNSTALGADGALDAALTMTLSASGGRTVISLLLENDIGGIWDTAGSSVHWALGVATSLDGALVNNASTISINVPVADGGSLILFASDYSGNTGFVTGRVLTLTVTFSDGSTAQTTTTIGGSGGGTTPPPPPPPPPPSTGTLRVFLTSPSSGATVGGVVWANIWLDGAAGSSNVYTLLVDGVAVVTQTDPGIHVTLPWTSTGTANGAHTLSATVRDATGNTGSTAITVTVGN
jgi:hypothetical protein